MNCLRVYTIVVLLCVSTPSIAQTKKPIIPSGRPSLDLLAARIEGYWNLLLQRKKQQAVGYITSSDREVFSNSQIPLFKNPRLKSLELSADRIEATATVIVKRTLFPLGQEMEWPVTEHWRFEKGNWYREFRRSFLPMPVEKKEVQKPADPQQAENAKREIAEWM
jgi:hypothetical protein